MRMLLLALVIAAAAQSTDREIIARSMLAYGDAIGMEFTLHVVDTNVQENSKTEIDLNVKTLAENVLVTYLAPRSLRGEKLLIKDRNIWFVSRNYPKPVAISPRQRRFGAAAYADIASKNLADLYVPTRLPDETVGGVPCDVFDLKAPASVSFSDVRYWVSKDRHLPVAARFHSASQNVTYEVKYETAGTIDRKGTRDPFVSRMTITGAGAITVLEYSAVRQKKFPPSEFDPSRLQHGAGVAE